VHSAPRNSQQLSVKFESEFKAVHPPGPIWKFPRGEGRETQTERWQISSKSQYINRHKSNSWTKCADFGSEKQRISGRKAYHRQRMHRSYHSASLPHGPQLQPTVLTTEGYCTPASKTRTEREREREREREDHIDGDAPNPKQGDMYQCSLSFVHLSKC
jgi:hypothetical protein